MLHPDKVFGRLGNRMFQMAYMYARMAEGTIPDVYVQDPRYFDQYKEGLKMLMNVKKVKTPRVAIHVRRGDYVKNSFYVDLMETEYYKNAMAEFPGEGFTVFSDDIEWCKQQDIFKDCYFSSNTDEMKDLQFMVAHKAHIIANSSFSWWGAYLSPNKGKVIAPKAWYSDNIERTICPEEWIRL